MTVDCCLSWLQQHPPLPVLGFYFFYSRRITLLSFCYEVSTIVESVLLIFISLFSLSFAGVYVYVFPYLFYEGFYLSFAKLGLVARFLGYFSLSSSFFYSTSSILSLSTYPLNEYLAGLKFGSIQT